METVWDFPREECEEMLGKYSEALNIKDIMAQYNRTATEVAQMLTIMRYFKLSGSVNDYSIHPSLYSY